MDESGLILHFLKKISVSFGQHAKPHTNNQFTVKEKKRKAVEKEWAKEGQYK